MEIDLKARRFLKVGKDLGSLKDLYKTIFERILEIDLKARRFLKVGKDLGS